MSAAAWMGRSRDGKPAPHDLLSPREHPSRSLPLKPYWMKAALHTNGCALPALAVLFVLSLVCPRDFRELVRVLRRIGLIRGVKRQRWIQKIVERHVADCLVVCYHTFPLGVDDFARKVYFDSMRVGLRDGEGRRIPEDG